MYALKKVTANPDHFYGLPEAAVELIQYGDFMCEHCSDVYPVVKSLREKLGADVRFIYRHYPLPAIHSLALEAAIAAEAAALHGKFWYMHDMIYENQKHILRSSFSGFAESIDLDMKIFEDSRGHKQLFHKVISDFEKGAKSGVDGTPTFFINGQQHYGFNDFESIYRTCIYARDSRAGAR